MNYKEYLTVTNPGNITSSGVVTGISYDTGNMHKTESVSFPTYIIVDDDRSKYKYKELDIISEFADYVKKTYGEHYKTDTLECFDAWIAKGTASSTAVDTAMKYLWRYGQKEGKNKKDLMKAMHYVLLCMYVDHYTNKSSSSNISQ